MEEISQQEFVKYPYQDEIDSAKKILELDHGCNRDFLISVTRLGTKDGNPKAEMPVTLAEEDFLIVLLGD